MANKQDFNEWKMLQGAVGDVFHARLGKDSLQIPGYRVDDRFHGVVSQRVVIHDPRLLSIGLMRELSASIRRLKLLGAQIEVVFDFSGADSGAAAHLRGLLIAHANGVDEAIFSLPELRAHYGASFYSD